MSRGMSQDKRARIEAVLRDGDAEVSAVAERFGINERTACRIRREMRLERQGVSAEERTARTFAAREAARMKRDGA